VNAESYLEGDARISFLFDCYFNSFIHSSLPPCSHTLDPSLKHPRIPVKSENSADKEYKTCPLHACSLSRSVPRRTSLSDLPHHRIIVSLLSSLCFSTHIVSTKRAKCDEIQKFTIRRYVSHVMVSATPDDSASLLGLVNPPVKR